MKSKYQFTGTITPARGKVYKKVSNNVESMLVVYHNLIRYWPNTEKSVSIDRPYKNKLS